MAIVRYTLDPNDRRELSPEALARIDALTPEQIEENARTDPDNPPVTAEEMARGIFGRDVRLVREGLGLSQKEFAARYNINLARLRDWEQGRFAPDSVSLAYLTIIAREPEMVRRILHPAGPVAGDDASVGRTLADAAQR
jgi:putative transcriptional regulator